MSLPMLSAGSACTEGCTAYSCSFRHCWKCCYSSPCPSTIRAKRAQTPAHLTAVRCGTHGCRHLAGVAGRQRHGERRRVVRRQQLTARRGCRQRHRLDVRFAGTVHPAKREESYHACMRNYT